MANTKTNTPQGQAGLTVIAQTSKDRTEIIKFFDKSAWWYESENNGTFFFPEVPEAIEQLQKDFAFNFNNLKIKAIMEQRLPQVQMTTGEVQEKMKQLDDDGKQKFVLNWRIPHSLFNVACRIWDAERLQGVDWFKIFKEKDMGTWSHGGQIMF